MILRKLLFVPLPTPANVLKEKLASADSLGK